MSTLNGTSRREVLEERTLGFHDVAIADVLEVIDYLRRPGDTVVAGGSLTFGLGNRLSDFDVVICGAETSRSLVPLEHWVKSLRVDVWTRPHADIDALFRLAREALGRPGPMAGAFGSIEQEQQLKLLHRIAFGLDLDGPALAPASVPDFREVARDLVIREYAERLRESVWVALVAARAGKWLVAVLNARQAVEEAFTVVLATRGVPFTGDKWLHERLKTDAPELRELYRRFAALPTGDTGAQYVEDAVALAGRLTGTPVDVGVLGAGVSWAGSGLHLSKAGADRLLVAPAVGGVWELSGDDLTAWAAHTVPAGPGNTAGPDKRDTQVPERRVWAGPDTGSTGFCLGLYELGLVSLVWDRGVPVGDLVIDGLIVDEDARAEEDQA